MRKPLKFPFNFPDIYYATKGEVLGFVLILEFN